MGKTTIKSKDENREGACIILENQLTVDEGQAVNGARGMPWHQEPKKDVTSCDKPRGAANKL